MSDEVGIEEVWLARAIEQAPAAARAEAEFFAKLDAHREKVGPCENCAWWLSQGLSPFCPAHEPTNND